MHWLCSYTNYPVTYKELDNSICPSLVILTHKLEYVVYNMFICAHVSIDSYWYLYCMFKWEHG